MKLLLDITHPAHVHFFKYAARIWQEHGHQVKFVSRDKEITVQLLDALKIPHQKLSKIRRGLLGLSIELIEHQTNLIKMAKRLKPDFILNIGGTFIVHAGKLLGIKTIVFTDTEHAKLSNNLTFPFAGWICTPDSFWKDLGKKHFRYNGYQELAYLHPNHFTPNPQILRLMDLSSEEKYFILRFVSWGASHDVGQKGLSVDLKMDLVKGLSEHGRVLITSEGPLPKELESYQIQINPIHIHDLLSYAAMYVGEGATMATEAAILGTPSVYINPLSSGNLDEISQKYQLMYHFTADNLDIEKVFALADQKDLKNIHYYRKEQMLKDKMDVTSWMVQFVESLDQ